ncbi:MAG: bile acid:sodium symporter [Desulfobacterales bacterium]
MKLVRKYWFLLGLAGVFVITLLEPTAAVARLGVILKQYHGADAVIFLIFLFSGMLLDAGQIRSGISDIPGALIALGLIFLIAPLLAAVVALIPLETGVLLGLFLVAVMPTTLSSGVVMSGAAGGNPAHALFITITANLLCMFTIPATLPFLLGLTGVSASEIAFDRVAVMIKIAFYVLVPLCIGLTVKYKAASYLRSAGPKLHIINQCLILCIVWMGVSQAMPVLEDNWTGMIRAGGLSALFHLGLLSCAFVSVYMFSVPRGRMESIIFMGSQKTLPLSIVLQVTLFPQYGQALVVCVLHHLVSLLIDGFLVGRFGHEK